jgi:hypothetical protein
MKKFRNALISLGIMAIAMTGCVVARIINVVNID